MFWFIAVIVILIVVFSISQAAKKTEEAQKRQEFNAQAQSRVSSYADFLKRTGQAQIEAMTDNEISDFIQQNIREYAIERKGLDFILAFIVLGGIIGGTLLAFANKSFGPLVSLSIFAVALAAFVYKQWGKSLAKKYEKRGLDVAKLRIEN